MWHLCLIQLLLNDMNENISTRISPCKINNFKMIKALWDSNSCYTSFVLCTRLLQCSATCGPGQKSRDVKCLDSLKRPTSGCDPALKPTERESCEERRCPQTGPGRPEQSGQSIIRLSLSTNHSTKRVIKKFVDPSVSFPKYKCHVN